MSLGSSHPAPAAPVTVRAAAKINLHLGVGPLRPDGYHELATVFQAVSWYDEIRASPAPELTVEVTGDEAAGVPTDETNLAARAVHALAEATGIDPAVRLVIHKDIPAAAGLGGGSADAAGALVACDALWGTGLDRAELATIGASVGSDVAFLVHGGTALGTGRGEVLTPVLARGTYSWVLAVADAGLATPDVYAELDRLRGPDGPATSPDAVLAALRTGDPRRLGAVLGNDLQAAALRLRPLLRQVLDAGRELGAVGGIVCGSGPTCAFLARSRSGAVRLAASLMGSGTCRTARVAEGPVAGARVH